MCINLLVPKSKLIELARLPGCDGHSPKSVPVSFGGPVGSKSWGLLYPKSKTTNHTSFWPHALPVKGYEVMPRSLSWILMILMIIMILILMIYSNEEILG